MSVKTKVILGLLLFGLLVWFFLFKGGPEEVIKKEMKALVSLVEKEKSESTLENAARGRKLARYFKDDSSIEYLPGRSVRVDGDAMAGAMIQARGSTESIALWILTHSVEMSEGGDVAESRIKVNAGVQMPSGQTESRTLDYLISWQKTDSNWQIIRVEVLD